MLTQKIPVATPKSVNWDWDLLGFLNFQIGIGFFSGLGFFGFFWDFLGFFGFFRFPNWD